MAGKWQRRKEGKEEGLEMEHDIPFPSNMRSGKTGLLSRLCFQPTEKNPDHKNEGGFPAFSLLQYFQHRRTSTEEKELVWTMKKKIKNSVIEEK